MYLRKIVANGFKSFADKVVITLSREHISGIVGPNGSGKSNVIDAVRWVMGEQNAKMLRGEKATDIIFAGSEKRKPLAMAEVSLIFDNSLPSQFCPPEYRHEPEIELTRRIYIDGEREYLINKKICRLKDIVSFFVSAGIGGRSYSMIQQGQVDRILQAKPEEIREMIDEAAGIALFKQRKLETEKRLEAITLNLSRLDDIFVEVTNQIANLKEQVQKAQEWQDLSAKLKGWEVELFAHNFAFFAKNIEELTLKIDAFNTEETAAISESASLEGEYERKRAKLEEADPQLQWIHNKIISHREAIARLETELIHQQESTDTAKKQLASYSGSWQDDEEEFLRFESQVKETEQFLKDSTRLIAELRDKAAHFEERLEYVDEEQRVFDQQIESFSSERGRLDNLLSNLRDRGEHLKKEMANLARDKVEIESKLSDLDGDLSKTDILSEAMGVKISQYQKQITQYYQVKSKTELDMLDKEKDLKNRRRQIEEAQTKRIEFQVGYQTIEEIEKNSQDLPSLVSKYLAENGQPEGLDLIVLTDLISFDHEKNALTENCRNVFEKWSERLILESFADLAKLDAFVKEQGWGIVPVSILVSEKSSAPEEINRFCLQEGLYTASQVLTYNQEQKQLAAFLASLVFIPEGGVIPSDKVLAKVTFFAANGMVSEGGISFLVGESQAGDGALSRKVKKDELLAELTRADAKLSDLTEKSRKCEFDIEASKKELTQLDQNLLKANKLTMEMEVEARGLAQKLELKREQTLEIRRRYNQIDERSDEIADNLQDIEEERCQYKEEKERVEEGLKEARQGLLALEDEAEELKRQTSDAKLELAKYLTKEATLKEHYSQNIEQLERLRKHRSERGNEIVALENKIKSSQEKQDEFKETITSLIFERDTFEGELENKKAKNAELVAEIKAIETKVKELREQINKSKKVSNDCRLDLERNHLALKGVRDQALEKYHMELDSYKFTPVPGYDLKERHKQISALKSKLDNFGAINMVAIDEYRLLCEREKFISEQRQDVLSSIELLTTAIGEIMEKSQSQYLETFRSLNVEFASLFPVLFPGGEGKLEMLDDTDPLNSGVAIIVRLPGKNPQNMSLFSGGERALTAIALIFAFLKSKPTPFCFLDEVDAPLDETNVGRFNKILELLSDRFQFIVITHRRRTMEALDALYGVTMQEPGVSKVVGVDLGEALPAHLQKAVKEFDLQSASAGFRQ